MKTNKFVDFLIKNRYVILCVSIVIILALTGVIKALIEIAIVIFLILIAIYIGKRIQEDSEYISKMFGKTKEYKYEYKVKDDENVQEEANDKK